jgi:glycosyltransferase involved in cell wall biosynthesis
VKIAILTNSSQRIHISRKELIKEIVDRNHELIIIGPKHETGPMHEALCKNNLDSFGVRFAGIEFDRIGMNPLAELKSIIKTYRVIKKESPELIISLGMKMALYSGVSAIFSGLDKVYPIINGRGSLFQFQGIKGFVVKAFLFPILKVIFSRCNIVFFQNSDDFEYFKLKKLVSENKGKVVNGSGVNLTTFSEVEVPLKPVFLLVARLIWAKGIREYIDAAIIVKNIFPEARFLLLGPFDDAIGAIKEEDLKNYIDLGVIEYKGTTSNVNQYYEMCSCYVLPSFYGEGVPRTILEAMATARPIITTNTPGCKETVEDLKNGFLVPPKESKILAEKMCWMIENHEKAKLMGKESRKYCERKFDVNNINKTILDSMGL